MKLSFCITCYDGDYILLERLLLALQKQTVAPDELIVYSSGFDDEIFLKTEHIKIAGKNIEIKYINSLERTIQSIARNVCASFASGNIIIFFDVDDKPHYQKIEITKNLFNQQNNHRRYGTRKRSRKASFSRGPCHAYAHRETRPVHAQAP